MVPALLLFALAGVAAAETAQSDGRHIIVKPGDTLVVAAGVEARILRTRSGEVRTALSSDGRDLVITIDESKPGASADGFVDRVYRFRLEQQVPPGLLWRGQGSIEQLDEFSDGEVRTGPPTLVTANGRFRLTGMLPTDAADATAIDVRVSRTDMRPLSARNYQGSRAFEDVEHIWLNHLENSAAAVRGNIDTDASRETGGIVISGPLAAPPSSLPPGTAADPVRAADFTNNPRFELPRILREVKPAYTADAMRRGVEGIVALDVTVDGQGVVTDVRVSQPLDNDLDEAAVEAVRGWRFAPARMNGQPVAAVVTIELTFTLKR